MSTCALTAAYEQIRKEAQQLAGGLNDLGQRATVYHHLFEDSKENHIFPLLAAHGALWARGYFRLGMTIGKLASLQYLFHGQRKKQVIRQLHDFADAFRDINRIVCVETYTTYHFTKRFGEHDGAENLIPTNLLTSLRNLHRANRAGEQLSLDEKRELFTDFFLNEQETIVGPRIDEAIAKFDWPLMKTIAMKPIIRFSFFPGLGFWVRNFADKQERIRRGQEAFTIANDVGLNNVVAALEKYDVLPASFFHNSANYFKSMKSEVVFVH